MREAILRVDRRGLLCTISRMFSHVFIVLTISLSDCTATCGRQPLSRNVWWTRVNTPLDRILLSGWCLRYSSTAAFALPSQNPYTKCISQYSMWEKTKGMFALHNSPTNCSALAKVTALPCLVAGRAHWTSMTSRTAYSTSTPQKPTHFNGHYLRNRSTLDIGVLGYIGIV